ncbi:hypothetical protein JW872_03045 [Candidatus Babeliales bacterium]|nr:hypothetical protein [Candidatus Babeliales bacterium]
MRRISFYVSLAVFFTIVQVDAVDQVKGEVALEMVTEPGIVQEDFKRWLPGLVSLGVLALVAPSVKVWGGGVTEDIARLYTDMRKNCYYESVCLSDEKTRCAICGPTRSSLAVIKLIAPVGYVNGGCQSADHRTLWGSFVYRFLGDKENRAFYSMLLVFVYGVYDLARTVIVTGHDIVQTVRNNRSTEDQGDITA